MSGAEIVSLIIFNLNLFSRKTWKTFLLATQMNVLKQPGAYEYFNDIREHFYLGNDFKQSLDALRRLYSNANDYDLKLTYSTTVKLRKQ